MHRLSGGRFRHPANHCDFAVGGPFKMRARFRFEQGRVREELPVQPDDGIRPGTRGRTMQNVKSVFAIDFRVGFVERDDMAEGISGVNHTAMFVFDIRVYRTPQW